MSEVRQQRPTDGNGQDTTETQTFGTSGFPLDDFMPYLLNRVTNRLNIDLREDLRDLGVSTTHWRVLAVLEARDGRSIGELAVYTMTDQSTLSRMITQMEGKNLVERRARPDDGRYIEVHITDHGRHIFDRILPIALHHYHQAVEGFSQQEVDQLVNLLHRLLDNIRRSDFA